MKVLLMHPVLRHEEPSRATLLDVMQRVTRGGLHHLRDHDLGVKLRKA